MYSELAYIALNGFTGVFCGVFFQEISKSNQAVCFRYFKYFSFLFGVLTLIWVIAEFPKVWGVGVLFKWLSIFTTIICFALTLVFYHVNNRNKS